MAAEGKMLVINAVLRFEDGKHFTLAHIVHLTGLSRQAAYHHLVKFEEKEYLSKEQRFYYVTNREGFYDEMDDLVRRRNSTDFLSKFELLENRSVDDINHITKFIRYYNALEIHVNEMEPSTGEKFSEAFTDLRKKFREQTEDGIKNLQGYKRFLSTRMKDSKPKPARGAILSWDAQVILEFLNHFCPRSNFTLNDVELLQNAVREYIEKEEK